MRRIYSTILPAAALVIAACNGKAQQQTQQQESSRQVANGGVSVNGWTGQIDPNEARRGQVISNAKLAMEGKDLHVTTGPAVAYWNPANTASGDYTVKATFTEQKYMSLSSFALGRTPASDSSFAFTITRNRIVVSPLDRF